MISYKHAVCALLLTSAAVSTSQAQIVLPNVAAITEADNTGTLLTFGAATIQFQFDQSQLTALNPGDRITGVSFRLNGASLTGPSTAVNYSEFTIKMAQAAFNDMSGATPAANMLNPQTVLSGPLTIGANTFPGGATPNNWSSAIPFDDSYTYQGGDLVFYLTYNGQTGGSLPLDSFLSGMGLGTTVFGKAGVGYEVTNLGFTGFVPLRLEVTAVPEPHEYGMVAGLGLLGFAVWRRQRRATAV